MSSSAKPSVVIVLGAWHCGEHFSSVRAALESAEYEVVTPDLPSSGASPGHMSFDADVEVVRSAVESLLNHGKDVVVATHSYGGVPGTQSLKGFAKKDRVAQHGDQIAGVIALLYIAAFMALPGESVQSIGTKGEETLRCWPVKPIDYFYQDVDPKVAEHATSILRSQSLPVFASTLTYPAWKDIPAGYLQTEDDIALPFVKQQLMVSEVRDAGANVEVETMQGGHSPFLTNPNKVANFVRRLAGEKGLGKL